MNHRFGHRVLGLPNTWLGRTSAGAAGLTTRLREWNYWWQAHYLDCLIDAQWRRSIAGEPVDLSRARALLRGIRLRNFFVLVNSFYDDMAWLALAVDRAQQLSRAARGRDFRGSRRVHRSLGRQLHQALSDELGGGIYWSKKRDYKNTAANGPAALYFARTGDEERAQEILDWLHERLWDAEPGVYVDGLHLRQDGPEREGTVWSYNQGPVLGALLELADHAGNLERAAELIAGISSGLTENGMVRLHGDGDRGLFTGILLRYLALAARHDGLPEPSRALAHQLVLSTAEQLWTSGSAQNVFTEDLQLSAAKCFPPGRPVGLSGQLQAWMAFESAHRLQLV